MPYLLLLYRYSVHQRSVAAAQVADGKLAVVRNDQAVPAGQRRIRYPELGRRVSSNRSLARRRRESGARLWPANAKEQGICFRRHSGLFSINQAAVYTCLWK